MLIPPKLWQLWVFCCWLLCALLPLQHLSVCNSNSQPVSPFIANFLSSSLECETSRLGSSGSWIFEPLHTCWNPFFLLAACEVQIWSGQRGDSGAEFFTRVTCEFYIKNLASQWVESFLTLGDEYACVLHYVTATLGKALLSSVPQAVSFLGHASATWAVLFFPDRKSVV